MGRGQRGGLKRGRGPVMGGVLVGGSWGKGRSLRRRGGRGLPEELPGFDWLLPPRLVLIWGKKMGVVREGRGSKGRGQGREKGAWLPTWEERHLVVGGVRRPGDPEVEAGPGGGRSQVGGEVTELSLPSRNPQKLLGGDRAPPHPTPRPRPPPEDTPVPGRTLGQDTQVWLGRGRPSPERHAPSRAEPSTVAVNAEFPVPTCRNRACG